MKTKIISILVILIITVCSYGQTNSVEFAPDGFPKGQSSPEGVSCDAVRAYLTSNPDLWCSTLVRPIYGPEPNKEYERFKKMMVEKTKLNAKDPAFPKMTIVKCYRARELSMNGPGSLAYAMEEFKGNMFVDIVVLVNDKQEQSIRYHVLLDKDKKWYFEPRPDLAPLFSMGMNNESASTEEVPRKDGTKAHPTMRSTRTVDPLRGSTSGER